MPDESGAPEKAAGGLKATLTRKVGPLPLWAYAVIAGGAVLVIRIFTGRTSSSQPSASAAGVPLYAPSATSQGPSAGSSSTSPVVGSDSTTAATPSPLGPVSAIPFTVPDVPPALGPAAQAAPSFTPTPVAPKAPALPAVIVNPISGESLPPEVAALLAPGVNPFASLMPETARAGAAVSNPMSAPAVATPARQPIPLGALVPQSPAAAQAQEPGLVSIDGGAAGAGSFSIPTPPNLSTNPGTTITSREFVGGEVVDHGMQEVTLPDNLGGGHVWQAY